MNAFLSDLMSVVTDFGNPGTLLALGALISLWLAIFSGLRAVVVWVAAVGAVGLVTGSLKIYFAACALAPLHIHSPSGHVAASTVLYGGLATILAARGSALRVALLAAAALLWIGAIGVSRVTTLSHTPQEVVAGVAIGGGVLALYAWDYARHAPPRILLWPLFVAAIVVVVVLRHLPLRFEPMFIDFGRLLHLQVPWICGKP